MTWRGHLPRASGHKPKIDSLCATSNPLLTHAEILRAALPSGKPVESSVPIIFANGVQ
jgi:hypothetical protein